MLVAQECPTLTSGMSLGEGKEARGEPASRYKAQNWTPELRARPRRRPSPGRGPSCPLRFQPRETLFSPATGAEAEKFPHVPLQDPKQQQKPHRSGRGSRCRAPAPTASRARPRLPADCGGEPLLTAAAPDAGRPSSSSSSGGSSKSSSSGVGQQRREEEVQRSRRASRSAAISAPRAAAAAATAPRSARALPSARLRRSQRRRLGSSPARPGPRGPLARPGGKTPGASLLQRGGRRAKKGSQYIPGESWGVARPLQVPGAATRRRLGILTVQRGGRRPQGGGRAPERAVPRTRTAAHARLPSPRAPSSRPAACRAPIPAVASRAAAAVQPSWRRGRRRARSPPPPCSPEPGTGAERARRALLLASGKPRRSDPPPLLPPPAPNPRERFPLTSAGGFKGCGDLKPSRSDAVAASLSAPLCPGPLYRASEETEWPPGGNLGAQRVGERVSVLAKNNSEPPGSCWGPGAVPVGGGLAALRRPSASSRVVPSWPGPRSPASPP